VPADCEFEFLSSILGGNVFSGKKLKAVNYWSNIEFATNESGFNALPGGFSSYFGGYNFQGNYSYLWSESELDFVNAEGRTLQNTNSFFSSDVNNKRNGQSIRCIKD
jgi:uncharacterized protein (TIGR02145 family)